jgi:hypothetical protein
MEGKAKDKAGGVMNCKDCKYRQDKQCGLLHRFVPRKGTQCKGETYFPKKH